jgi:hypothetical protein
MRLFKLRMKLIFYGAKAVSAHLRLVASCTLFFFKVLADEFCRNQL